MIEQRERFAAEEEDTADRRDALRECWPGLAFSAVMLLLLLGCIVYLLISLF